MILAIPLVLEHTPPEPIAHPDAVDDVIATLVDLLSDVELLDQILRMGVLKGAIDPHTL